MLIDDENTMPEMLGRSIGQYQLIELLGKGDTSFVYKAFQPGMSRYVAVKVLFPSLATSQEFMEHFQRRLARISTLQHNHILPIYDYGQQDDLLYLVTRYVEAGTLENYLPDYYLPQEALRIIQALAEALDYAYSHGLVHGNLKPENILIDEEQRPFLTDFGGLRQEPIIPRISSPYTSPEQVQGVPIDQRSDVYGLGALLYTLLVGEPPPPGRVPTPRAYRPDLSQELEKVILKAMAPAPQQRYQSAGEFSRAFERALQTQPTARPPQAQAAVQPERDHDAVPVNTQDSRSLSGLIVFLGTLALLAAVAAVYFVFFRGDDEAAPVPTAPPGVPVITANTDVNVREGPGSTYTVVGVMRQGQTAEAIGVSPDNGWWVIRFPAVDAGRGWVSSQYTAGSGTENLPIVQPPPLPTTEPAPTDESPTELPPPTDEPTMEAIQPLPISPTPDEIAAEPTLPTVEEATAEAQPEPGTEVEGAGPGLCAAPGILLFLGLVFMLPLGRRRF